MIDEVKNLINNYVDWLKRGYEFNLINEWIEVTTPFLDNHNDYIQLYIRKLTEDKIEIIDDGETLKNLEMSGVLLSTNKRKDILQTILNIYGISVDNKTLKSVSTLADFPQKKHEFIQAILSINDMFVLSKKKTIKIFKEMVINYLKTNEIRHTIDIGRRGKSRYIHHFDILIPGIREVPERYIQTFNYSTITTVSHFLWMWSDYKLVSHNNLKAYAFLNDMNPIGESQVTSLHNYEVTSVKWSEKDRVLEELVA